MPIILIVLAAICWACGGVSTPTAASGPASTSTGFLQNGDVRLSYQLDVPQHTGPVGAAREPRIHDLERVVFAGAGHDLRGANYWPEIDRWLAKIQR